VEAIRSALPRREQYTQQFKFRRDEFDKEVGLGSAKRSEVAKRLALRPREKSGSRTRDEAGSG